MHKIHKRILIIQTAFLGDVVLTLPLLQVLKKNFSESEIDFLCIPVTSELLKNNPYVNEVIIYDKRNAGRRGFTDLIRQLRKKKYDIIISPHRSFRSSLISKFSKAGKTISFDKSSMSFLYDIKVKYHNELHEISRNLKLTEPLGIFEQGIIKPELFINENEKETADTFLKKNNIYSGDKIICIAPGSVWFTKRFPKEKFVKLCDLIESLDCKIIITGSESDKSISEYIIKNSKNKNILDTTGMFSILESAELIRRSALLITNDSAPLHIANSVDTKVIAIFGATIPAFGFYPYGMNDIIIETNGLACRPCSIHGGNECPVKTFDCMMNINEETIFDSVMRAISIG